MAVSPDLTQYAILERQSAEESAGTQLCVGRGEQQRRIPLPEVPNPYCPGCELLWAATSPVIAVRYSEEWEDYGQSVGDQDDDTCGFVLVNTITGACQTVGLPCQDDLLFRGGSVQCTSWSSKGHLIVRHGSEDGIVLAVYAADGTLVASTYAPQVEHEQHQDPIYIQTVAGQACWAPSSDVCSLQLWGAPVIWLWHPFTPDAPRRFDLGPSACGVRRAVWAPCSTQLLVEVAQGPALWCLQDGRILQQVTLDEHQRQIGSGPVSGLVSLTDWRHQIEDEFLGYHKLCWHWGSEVKVFPAVSSFLIRVYAQQPPVRSPCGALCAAVTWFVEGSSAGGVSQSCVDIFSWARLAAPAACAVPETCVCWHRPGSVLHPSDMGA